MNLIRFLFLSLMASSGAVQAKQLRFKNPSDSTIFVLTQQEGQHSIPPHAFDRFAISDQDIRQGIVVGSSKKLSAAARMGEGGLYYDKISPAQLQGAVDGDKVINLENVWRK